MTSSSKYTPNAMNTHQTILEPDMDEIICVLIHTLEHRTMEWDPRYPVFERVAKSEQDRFGLIAER